MSDHESDSDFDIDRGVSQKPIKRILRSSRDRKHSDSENDNTVNEEEEASLSPPRAQRITDSNSKSKRECRRIALQKLQQKTQRRQEQPDVIDLDSSSSSQSTHNDNDKSTVSGKKRKRAHAPTNDSDFDDDEDDDNNNDDDDDDDDAYGLHEDDTAIEPAMQFVNDEYDGPGLKSFYRDTLGIESESDSDSDDDDDQPSKKRRKLNQCFDDDDDDEDENVDPSTPPQLPSQVPSQQSFGGLPFSQDVMGKIAQYVDLCQVARTLSVINRDFCAYFNGDRYWKTVYCLWSKTVMSKCQIKHIKSYKLKTGKKLYKRRILWYSTIAEKNTPVFERLRTYIPPMRQETKVGVAHRHQHYVDRSFLIKIYLIKECVVMHRRQRISASLRSYRQHDRRRPSQRNGKREKEEDAKCNNDEEEEEDEVSCDADQTGIEPAYRLRDEDMDVVLPLIRQNGYSYGIASQLIATCDAKYKQMNPAKFGQLYAKLLTEWKSQTDIFDAFRFAHQYFVEYQLNVMMKEDVKDLQFLCKLQQFYEQNMGQPTQLISTLCDDDNDIHDTLQFDQMDKNTITVSIESPKSVLHEQVRYVMLFINCYKNGRLMCELNALRNELKARNIIHTQQQFENIKVLIDEQQFEIRDDCIAYIQ